MLANSLKYIGTLFFLFLIAPALTQAQCDARFMAPQKACIGDSLVFTASDTTYIRSTWNFGDGNSDTGSVLVHPYAQAGSYFVQHILEDIGGCIDTLGDSITILPYPKISFTTDQNCGDSLVDLYGNLNASSQDTLQALWWYTGTGDSLQGDTIIYPYPSSGNYSIQVRAIGTACISVLDTNVFIKQKPDAQFSWNSKLCKGDTLSFQFTGNSYKPRYAWNFGDVFSGNANLDSVANPKHRFSNSGNYSLRLVITDTLSCRDTLIQSIHINSNAQAAFDYSNGCLGLNTLFTNSSQIDVQDTTSSYYWDFGDGDTSSISSPTHTFPDTGSYTVRLILETTAGCIDTSELTTKIFPQPLISLSADSSCRGIDLNYQLLSSNTSIQSFLWNFGDGFTSSSSNPVHQYSLAGNYYVNLKTTFTNSRYCTSKSDSVRVLAPPSATFVIDNDTQCFKGNQVCVSIINQSPSIKRRRVLFDDGFVDIKDGPTDTFACHSYTDAAGSSYFIAVQMLDSNGCSQSISSDTAILIHPEFDTDFSQSTTDGCFVTQVHFTNNSNQSPPNITDFEWDFGDGSTNTTNWSNLSHAYGANGSFTVKLWVKNDVGCVDSSFGSSSVTNINYTVDAAIDSIRSTCSSNNRIYAHQTPISGASIKWVWNSGDTSQSFTSSYSYEFPGIYRPFVRISLNGCDSIRYLDTLTISGPYARIGSISNRYQCQISDTVYAVNTSTYYQNTQRGSFWDFGDIYAPSCTTNYLAGINATGNCRYATDSVSTKHFYDRNHEGCYYIRLIAFDSITGCSDTVTENVSLAPPVAGPDTSNGLNGLFTIQTKSCLGPETDKTISISLTQTQPLCGKESYWVMWDSACAMASGNFNGQWLANQTEHNYDYNNAPCDSNGYVTIGLIIQNGDDSLGNFCRDTAWYSRILRFNFMDPGIGSNYDSNQYYCKNSSFDFYLQNQTQDSVNRVIWNWGDGSSTDTTTLDTIPHLYTAAGYYQVTNQIFTTDGCTGTDTFNLAIGTASSLSFSSSTLCYGDSFQILPDINYLNNGINYWADASRIAANKEALFFDLDDGNGYQNLGIQPWIQNDEIKNYTISVAYRDSLSCWDTVSYSDSVRVFGVFAGFSAIRDTFLCPQAIAFTDLSSLYDTVHSYIQADDSLVNWSWNFGANLASSSLQNPERYLSPGNYQIKLISTNSTGCKDSVIHDIVIVGPQASYSITSDSVGCEPLRVYFKNESSNATNYVWQFNDSSNAVLSTASDSIFYFDYALYGNFVPSLTAQGSFNQGGILVTCESVFPDSTAWDSLRLVSVHETPEAGFSFNTDCANKSSSFANTSITANNSTLRYLWDFGDGDTSSSLQPTHFYADTGHYFVILHVFSEFDCEDTIGRQVIIAPQPVAYFTFNEVCIGATTLFEDSTEAFNDLIYDWQWDFGDGGSSTLENPFHDYGSDSNFTITLIVTNIGGCQDTVSRNVRIHSYPNASFTSSSECRDDSVQLTSTSSELPLSYIWNLGDGNSSTSNTFKHKYANSGAVLIRMRIETPWGCADSTNRGEDIYQEPIANFDINDTAQCYAQQGFTFTDLSATGTGTYTVVWDYGDGNSASGSPANHTYTTFGDYTVTMIATSSLGCSDTSIQSLHVYPVSDIGFAIDDAFQCEYGNSFTFTDTSSIVLGNISRTWLAGDGSSSSDSIYTHSYSDTGRFTIQLIQESTASCRDTIRQEIVVNPSPRTDFVSNDSTQCFLGNQFDFINTSTVASGTMSSRWNFGDGGMSSLANPSHSYNLDSTWTIQLIMLSDSGCADTIKHLAITYPMPVADFTPNDSRFCLSGNSFVFYDSTAIDSGTWTTRWEFGDGDTSVQAQPSHTYTQEGIYTVLLVSTSNFLCIDSTTKDMEVYPMPSAIIGAFDTAQCFRENLFSFSDSSTLVYGNYTREWNFGDGGSDTNQYSTHAYLKDSSFELALRIVSGMGCSDSAFQSLIIYPQAATDFSINDSIQCFSDHLFQFTNQSGVNNGNLSYTWDFGDGMTDTSDSPFHSYLIYGDYSVQLIANTLFACSDTVAKSIRIDPNPKARIWLNDSFQCINAQQFELRDSSKLAEGSYMRYWDLGDGDTSTQALFIHPYTTLGIQTISLLLITDKDCRDSSDLDIEVFPKPDPAFIIDDSAQCENTSIFQFTNQSGISSGSISSCWMFGDGDSSLIENPSKTYTYADTFRVVLTMTSNEGCMDSVGRALISFPKPHAIWVINDTAQCVNTNDFQFVAQTVISSGNFRNYFWDLENLLDTGDLDTARTYATAGTYPVYFYVQSELDCWDTLQNTLTVHPKPRALFSVNDSDQCVNTQQFVFSNQSSISAGTLSYFWEFGDGDTSSMFEPNKTYLAHDSVDIILYAKSALGCYDTTQHELIILPKPEVVYTVNDSDQCINGNRFTFTNSSTIDYGILSYFWDFGNGERSNSLDTTIVYGVYGTYPVELKALSNAACSDSLEFAMIVYPKPTPGFSMNDEGQCFNTQDFQITDESSIAYGNIHYTYRFGDLLEDTLASPGHYYSAFGNYTIRQVLVSDYLCKDSMERDVRVFPKPVSIFSSNDSTQCINTQNFKFSSSSGVAVGNLIGEFWDFDDGNTAIGRNTSHYYPLSDFYDVTLRVQTDSNCWDTLSQVQRVFPKPIARIEYNDSAQCLSTNLYEVYSLGFDSTGIDLWSWNIDIDSTAADSAFTYHFKTIGQKTFRHRLKSMDGCWDTTSRLAFVKPMPNPAFTGLSSFHCSNEPAFALKAVVPGGLFSGKNIVNQLYEPRILWEDTVKYWVIVNGCADSSTQYTNVFPFPEVELGSDTVLCKNEFMPFDLSYWNSTYTWRGKISDANVEARSAGTYYATVTNVCGTASDSVTISFLDDLCRIYLPNAFTPNSDDYNQTFRPVEYALEKMDYKIYNRWGQLMYEADINATGWDGTFEGTPVKQDVYIIRVRYEYTLHGEKIVGFLDGNITLLR